MTTKTIEMSPVALAPKVGRILGYDLNQDALYVMYWNYPENGFLSWAGDAVTPTHWADIPEYKEDWSPIMTAPKEIGHLLGFDPCLRDASVIRWDSAKRKFIADGSVFFDEKFTHYVALTLKIEP